MDIVLSYSFCFDTSTEKSLWSVDKNLLYGKCLGTSIFTYLLECGQLYLAVNFFTISSKSDRVFRSIKMGHQSHIY